MTVQLQIKDPQEAIDLLNKLIENKESGCNIPAILLTPLPGPGIIVTWRQIFATIFLTLIVGFFMAIVAAIGESRYSYF